MIYLTVFKPVRAIFSEKWMMPITASFSPLISKALYKGLFYFGILIATILV